jgi:hypothetical protein
MRAGPDFAVRRLAGGLVVLLLHAVLIVALLEATGLTTMSVSPVREIVLQFSTPKPRPPGRQPLAERARRPTAARRIPGYSNFTLPPQWRKKPLKGLSFGLDCGLESEARLTLQGRAQCAAAEHQNPGNDTVDFADHTGRSQNAALWNRGRARKNAPLLLPCASPQGIGVGLGTLICLGHGLLHGFDLDNQPGYGDRPETVHIPNNGDPPTTPPG